MACKGATLRFTQVHVVIIGFILQPAAEGRLSQVVERTGRTAVRSLLIHVALWVVVAKIALELTDRWCRKLLVMGGRRLLVGSKWAL